MSFVVLVDLAAPILCGFAVLGVVAHIAEEVFGPAGPFWRYYRRLFGGPRLPDPAGRALFALLAAAFVALAVGGLWYGDLFLLGALAGAMAGDLALSHVGLRLWSADPNPGLVTAIGFYVPTLLLVALFVAARDVLPTGGAWSWPGTAAGAGAFAAFWLVSFARRLTPPAGAPGDDSGGRP